MRATQNRTVYAGIALIALGIFALLDLWWMLPVLVLAGGGAFIYSTRRQAGHLNEGVQGGLWGFGLGLIMLLNFSWVAGILLLAGGSMLLRGREQQADALVQRLLGRTQAAIQARRNRGVAVVAPVVQRTPSVPISSVTIVSDEQATLGETTRLRS